MTTAVDTVARAEAAEAKHIALSTRQSHDDHEKVCAERYAGINKRLDEIMTIVRALQGRLIGALLTLVCLLLTGIGGLIIFILSKGA